jgi:hypothetical protein
MTVKFGLTDVRMRGVSATQIRRLNKAPRARVYAALSIRCPSPAGRFRPA